MTGSLSSRAIVAATLSAARPTRVDSRPEVCGKFLVVGNDKLYVRGVTYGPFRPCGEGGDYHDALTAERDFRAMAAHGINAVRTYTVPPRWLLDLAHASGLYVLVGIDWEQHVTFLDDSATTRRIVERVRAGVRGCAGHPAVLGYAVGNEIPAPIARWHGRRRVEQFVRRLYEAAKAEDPAGLVTYVNYPTTEYLALEFLDFVSFNVYLESRDRLEAYLARLHNLAGDRPLVMAEVGYDSRRNGEARQAEVLDWQVRSVFGAGAAGIFLFAWTDEWYRGGYDVEDWDFGLTRRDRRPKPSLESVRDALGDMPVAGAVAAPLFVSVIVCSHNGASTIRDCLEGVQSLEYPRFEVIVVDDGSRDATRAIAEEFGVRVISGPQRGLSAARNIGLAAARGDIVAYVDDDARPDRHWLHYITALLVRTPHAGVGGPNIPTPGDGVIAECVANAPGGPVHVLLDDQHAEHIPGCNMAWRSDQLRAIGGFDPRFTAAGDDVDVCWRILDRGWTIGFSPSAVVWHRRRNSLRAYWKQQQGYGKAEALLEAKWPQKFNAAGHVSWLGRIYGNGTTRALLRGRGRVYQGVWGTAPFQSLYEPAASLVACLPMMPEWYLAIALLGVLVLLGGLWAPLLGATGVLLVAAVGISVVQAAASARRAVHPLRPRTTAARLGRWALTTMLHLIQPLARLGGRIGHGLTPWRMGHASGLVVPRPRRLAVWAETWAAIETRLRALRDRLLVLGMSVQVGGAFDRWDLEVHGGVLGAVRVLVATEEHGSGKQLVRVRVWPIVRPLGLWLAVPFAVLTGAAATDGQWLVAVGLGLIAAGFGGRTAYECAAAEGAVVTAVRDGRRAAD